MELLNLLHLCNYLFIFQTLIMTENNAYYEINENCVKKLPLLNLHLLNKWTTLTLWWSERSISHWKTVLGYFCQFLTRLSFQLLGTLQWTQVAKLPHDNLFTLPLDEIVINYARGIKTSRPWLDGRDGVMCVCVKNVWPYNWLQSSLELTKTGTTSPRLHRQPPASVLSKQGHKLSHLRAFVGKIDNSSYLQIAKDSHKGACWRLARLLTCQGLDWSSSGYMTLWKHWRCLGILRHWGKKEQSFPDDPNTRPIAQCLRNVIHMFVKLSHLISKWLKTYPATLWITFNYFFAAKTKAIRCKKCRCSCRKRKGCMFAFRFTPGSWIVITHLRPVCRWKMTGRKNTDPENIKRVEDPPPQKRRLLTQTGLHICFTHRCMVV